MRVYWAILWRYLLLLTLFSYLTADLIAQWMQDERLIKIRPTAITVSFALLFLILLFFRNAKWTRFVWKPFNSGQKKLIYIAFIVSMIGIGIINLLVAKYLSTDAWVTTKLFYGLVLLVVPLFVMVIAKRIGQELTVQKKSEHIGVTNENEKVHLKASEQKKKFEIFAFVLLFLSVIYLPTKDCIGSNCLSADWHFLWTIPYSHVIDTSRTVMQITGCLIIILGVWIIRFRKK